MLTIDGGGVAAMKDDNNTFVYCDVPRVWRSV